MSGRQQPTVQPSPGARMLTVSDVAALLSVSTMSVYRLIDLGELRAFRIGRTIRVRTDDYAAFMRSALMGGEE